MQLCKVILLLLLTALIPAHAEDAKANPVYKLDITADDMTMGSKDAPVVIVEYSSLVCPHCATFHKDVFSKIEKEFIATGKVYYVHRDYVSNKVALTGAKLNRCSGKDRYFVFLKVLFDKQESWAFKSDYESVLKNIAKLGGIGEETFKKCMDDKALEDKLIAITTDAHKNYKIEATPTIFLNGEAMKSFFDYEDFKRAIELKLSAAAK